MTLQIREGGFYERRDGEKAGPMVSHMPEDAGLEWRDQKFNFTYYPNGTHCGNQTCQYDLVAEWSEPAPQEAGPVRIVTRQEIVPGNYGRLNINHAIYKRDAEAGDISVVFTDRDGKVGPEIRTLLNASELRAAARVFNSLAEALESQP